MAWTVSGVTRRKGGYKVYLVNEAISRSYVATKRDGETPAEFLAKAKANLSRIAETVVPQAVIDQLEAVDFNG